MPEDKQEKQYKEFCGTFYDIRTPHAVMEILHNHSRTQGKRLQIFYGDTQTGKVWEGIPERGTIGRSTGPVPIPLLIKTTRSLGGEAILDYCIVEIRESPGGKVLYKLGREKELRGIAS